MNSKFTSLANLLPQHSPSQSYFSKICPMFQAISIKSAKVLLLALIFATLHPTTTQAQSGSIDWNGWTFDYRIGIFTDGLAIQNVSFEGTEIMGLGNFPAMPVYYDNNACGPYLDRLDNDLEPVPWANNATLVSRQFTSNGEEWYELGIREFIGQYDIYQVWYFNGDGIINAHLFSRGLQCQEYHEHWPHWRFDFDIAGSENDQILRETATGPEAYETEFNVSANSAINHGWIVRDTVTNDSVQVSFDSGEWTPSGTIEAEIEYAKNRVAGRLYNNGEEAWHASTHSSLPSNWNDGIDQISYGDDENINGSDVVLWYSGYLPHQASDGADLWHSTGVRITVNIGPEATPTPTNTPMPEGTPMSTNTPVPTNTPTPEPTNTPVPTVTPTPTSQTVLGNTNCNGIANSADAMSILQFTVGERTAVESCPLPDYATMLNISVADVNADGKVNSIDALLILQCDANISNVFCP